MDRCLTNIATGSHDQTWTVLQCVPILLQILSGSNPSLQELTCWTIGNISGDSDEFREILISNGAFKPLMDFAIAFSTPGLAITQEQTAKFVRDSNSSRTQTAVWALSNLARGSTSASLFIDAGASLQLMNMIKHPDILVVAEVLWIFVFLVAKDESSVETLLSQGLIKVI
jgi:hypothetical protein